MQSSHPVVPLLTGHPTDAFLSGINQDQDKISGGGGYKVGAPLENR